MDRKIKHLEMIEEVISRMGRNSFLVKGWALTLVSIILAIGTGGWSCLYGISAVIPLIIFAVLDAYYLQLERKYRALYEKVRETDEEDIDFNLNPHTESGDRKTRLISCLFSKSIILYYSAIAFLIVIVIVVGYFVQEGL